MERGPAEGGGCRVDVAGLELLAGVVRRAALVPSGYDGDVLVRERQDQKRKKLCQPRNVVRRGKVHYSFEEIAHLTLRRILPAGFDAGIVGVATATPPLVGGIFVRSNLRPSGRQERIALSLLP